MFPALILGLTQGLTEFIPVSSSGHLVLVPYLLGFADPWNQPTVAFDATLHLATLLALLVFFRADLNELLRSLVRGPNEQRRLAGLLALASIPAALAGLLLADFFEKMFKRPLPVALLLLGTAAILLTGDWIAGRRRTPAREDVEDTTLAQAVAIGMAQAMAILPGISRSGSTISTGIATGLSREAAARFSFLLAIPAIGGAAAVQVPKLFNGAGPWLGAGPIAVGFVAAAVTGYLSIGYLLRRLAAGDLRGFAKYCVVAGVLGVLGWAMNEGPL
ncbi:MAG: undecaprenyl-diphosphate phosphatase [Actinomycetota bacterium]